MEGVCFPTFDALSIGRVNTPTQIRIATILIFAMTAVYFAILRAFYFGRTDYKVGRGGLMASHQGLVMGIVFGRGDGAAPSGRWPAGRPSCSHLFFFKICS